MAFEQLQTCLSSDIHDAVLTATGGQCGQKDTPCTAQQMADIATAKLTPSQCMVIAQTCQQYNHSYTYDAELRSDCIRELSGGMCMASATSTVAAGVAAACRSAYDDNMGGCGALHAECQAVAEPEVVNIGEQLKTATPVQRDLILARDKARQTAQQKLAAQGCTTGYCVTGGKNKADLCPKYSEDECTRDTPCRWEDGRCQYDASGTYACYAFTGEAQCSRYNCTWLHNCVALPQDSRGCRHNMSEATCPTPDCRWDVQDTYAASMPLDEACIARARGDGSATDTATDTATDATTDAATDAATDACHLPDASERMLNAATGGDVGSTMATACSGFQQENLCEKYGCTWKSQQSWKCTSMGDARLESLCNVIADRSLCNNLSHAGFCQSVAVDVVDTIRCSADCDWPTEAGRAFSVGVKAGAYEKQNSLRLGVENVMSVLDPAMLPLLTQKPTLTCPHVCDGHLLRMWLEAGMASQH
jgi:hypothetical protein